MFIAIEGIDGAGKTCVAKSIADKLGYDYSGQKALGQYLGVEEKEYLRQCSNFRNNVNSDCDRMYWLYALSCLLVADKENVVCDRHLGTVHFWYGNENNECIAQNVYKLSRKPDMTFLLNVSLDKAIERTNSKYGINDKETDEYKREIEKVKRAPFFKDKAEKFFEKFDIRYEVIETDEMTLEQVINIVEAYIIDMEEGKS